MRRIKTLPEKKTIALVAHDHKKDELLEWVQKHAEILKKHNLVATGTTGRLVEEALQTSVQRMMSGPLGGDQQLGAKIATQEIDIVIFFMDPMEALPHDSDVRAFLRLCVVWNTPIALDAATADFIISSPYIDTDYQAPIPDYNAYLNRKL